MRGHAMAAALCVLLLAFATTMAEAQHRTLKQAGSMALPPRAVVPRNIVRLVAPPPINFAAMARSAPSVNTDNGAYLGCYDVTKLAGIAWNTQKEISPITGCRKYCEDWYFAFTIIKSWGACLCTNEIPEESSKLANSACDNKANNAVAFFYNDKNSNARGCRILRVPMQSSSFRWAYNQDKTSFQSPNQMTIRMDGDSGARLYFPTAIEYGLVEVKAKVSGVSGVISAFYLRSDTQQETTDFSEIDFEFLNARPGVTGSFWTNSFKGGQSFGEQMIPPSSYKQTLGTNCAVNDCFYKFQIHWQPNQVSWIVNNRILRRNYYGQQVKWCDMNNKCTTKEFRPPVKPSFPTFSMWHDIGGNGAFGGTLGPGSPFSSFFRDLKMIACDTPVASYNGPSWASPGGSPAPPPSPAPNPNPSPAPGPAPGPAPPPSGGCRTTVAAWGQCGGKGGECTVTNVCADAVWSGYCCGSGYKCEKKDQYYWQCVQGTGSVEGK